MTTISMITTFAKSELMTPREITRKYEDPLNLIWIHAAKCCGIRVIRDAEVFAAWDGIDTLRIGQNETLDPDDSLAQMIFHELCHALVEGPAAQQQPDWGLVFGNQEHEKHEHACLRLQAALADPYQLREFLASTTDYREYYDQLPADPLANQADPATGLALAGYERATSGPWAEPVRQALERTQALKALVQHLVNENSIWSV